MILPSTFLSRRAAFSLIVAALLVFSGGFLAGQQAVRRQRPPTNIINSNRDQPDSLDFGLFWEAWNRVDTTFAGQKNNRNRLYGAISGMIGGLGDPYSIFLPPTEAKKFSDDINGNFDGIGAELIMKNDRLTVVAALDDSPAQRAGLKSDDVIIKIDGQDVPKPIDEAVAKIRGPKGTNVTLTIVRDGVAKEIPIVRANVEVASVSEKKVGNVVVVKINQFNSNTTRQLDDALRQIAADNAKGIVVDLRNNPGGLLDVAVEVSSRFLAPETPVVIERDRNGKETVLATDAAPTRTNLPLIVVQNKGSASAAEIVAGALQDHGRAKIVGEASFGKGSVQSVQSLSDGSSVRLSIAEWFTPKKRAINAVGITPDIVVRMTEDDIKAGRDPQLDRALAAL